MSTKGFSALQNIVFRVLGRTKMRANFKGAMNKSLGSLCDPRGNEIALCFDALLSNASP
jgi:hypothetical protein